jgi:hypothetical protein
MCSRAGTCSLMLIQTMQLPRIQKTLCDLKAYMWVKRMCLDLSAGLSHRLVHPHRRQCPDNCLVWRKNLESISSPWGCNSPIVDGWLTTRPYAWERFSWCESQMNAWRYLLRCMMPCHMHGAPAILHWGTQAGHL